MLMKGLTPAAAGLAVVEKLPSTVFNAAIAIICAPMLAIAIRSGLQKNRLTLD